MHLYVTNQRKQLQMTSDITATKEESSTISAIRRGNRRKLFISLLTLFFIWLAFVIFFASQAPSQDPDVVADRLGNLVGAAIFDFMFSLMLAVAISFLSKKPWTWGIAVFWAIATLIFTQLFMRAIS